MDMTQPLTYNNVLKALRWYLENKLIPSLLCDVTIKDYINDNTNLDRLCLYRFKYKSVDYVRIIYKNDSVEKITLIEYDISDESNLLFGNCLFKSKKDFEVAYDEACSRLADEQCLKQIQLTKSINISK